MDKETLPIEGSIEIDGEMFYFVFDKVTDMYAIVGQYEELFYINRLWLISTDCVEPLLRIRCVNHGSIPSQENLLKTMELLLKAIAYYDEMILIL